MKNLENEKVLWQPVLCRYLRACYHSAVTNRKRPALKISVTDDSITTVSRYLSCNGTGCYRLVLCCRCCTARTSLTWKWLFLCREVNFWFTSYIFWSCLGDFSSPTQSVYSDIFLRVVSSGFLGAAEPFIFLHEAAELRGNPIKWF